jgi:hypothetical protein
MKAHGDVHDATVLRMVGTDIAQLSQQVESIRTDEGVPPDVRERLAPIDDELARIARLTGGAATAPAPRLPEDAVHAHRLAAHLTNPMAYQLNVSITTVRTHVQSLLAKLGVNSRLQAVTLAIRTALLDAGH